MKILMLTDRMEAGGAETHIAQLILGLREIGCEVALLSGGGALADELEKLGIRQYRVSLPTHDPFRLLAWRRYVRKLTAREHFDILHAHARIPALLIRGCERYGAAGIVTVHALFRTNAFLSRVCHWGGRTVAVSEDLRQYVCEVYGVPAERVCVIPNGIDLERFYPKQEPQEHADGTIRILFASRLDADCSLGAELLCALAPTLCTRYPTLRICIAGGGSELGHVGALAREANRILGRVAVTLTGWVADMPSLLREQDIFVGVSRAAMEACASGCAVILCGNEGYFGMMQETNIREAMLSNFCARGYANAKREWLERDLVRLLESPMLRRRCADSCMREIRDHFGADRMCRETLTLYHRALLTPKRRSVVIGGYYGCGNAGDDAILLGLLEALHAAAPDIGVTVLSGAPRRDRRRFGVRCVCRRSPLSVLWAFLRSDALLFGGGSLLQNTTSNRSLSYYLCLLNIAHFLHRPVFFYAAGIGPLLGRRAVLRARHALARCRYISLRDGDSMNLLREAGVDAARLHMGADPALLMPMPPTSRADAILREQGISARRRLICVVLRGGREAEKTRTVLLAAVRMLCRRHGLFPIFPIFDAVQDAGASRAAQKLLGGRAISLREPADAVALIGRTEVLLSMRLHALIFSSAAGIPAVGVPSDVRDGKIAAFAKGAGQDCITADRVSVGLLVERAEAAMRSQASLRPILEDSVAEQRKKARKDLANIVEMVYNIKQ